VRQGINLTYSVGWVRQEENQYLSTPIEVARTLDDDLLRLIGYQVGGLAMGYVRDFEDPMVMIHEGMPKEQYDLSKQHEKVFGGQNDETAAFYEALRDGETPSSLVGEPA
jgi:ectoine hydroxylase-related dioxygenase (phytanoyl-CoA dioxygenase family)